MFTQIPLGFSIIHAHSRYSTVEEANASNVVFSQLEVRVVSLVPRCHEGARLTRVIQSQRVTYLVCS